MENGGIKMETFNEEFMNLTIGNLLEITKQYKKMENLLVKQEETLKKLKIKYPNIKEDFNLDEFIKKC